MKRTEKDLQNRILQANFASQKKISAHNDTTFRKNA